MTMKSDLINHTWSWEFAVTAYLDYLRASGSHSPVTIANRKHLLVSLSQFALQKGIATSGDLSKKLISLYFQSKSVTNGTKATQLNELASFCDFLESEYVIEDNYAKLMAIPKIKRKVVETLTDDELSHVYKCILENCKIELIDRDLALFDLLLFPALRVSELIGIRVKDILFDEVCVVVKRKGGHEQKLPIQVETLQHIESMLEPRPVIEPDDFLFLSYPNNKPLSRRGAEYIVNTYLEKKAGIVKKKLGPHLLRHTGATNILRGGIDIVTLQKLLGHSNVQTTMIYSHTDLERQKSAAASIPNIGKKILDK